MYRVKIAGIDEFRESKDAWNEFVLSMSIPSIFCTWEWVYTWWEHFGGEYEPVVLFVYDGAELKGILPLASHKNGSKGGLLSGRKLSYCASTDLYPDHLDVICHPEDANGCLSALFNFLSSEYTDWDVLHVSNLSEGSGLTSYLNGREPGLDAEIRQSSVAPYVGLSGSFEEYIKTFDSKQRNNIKRRQKKLYEQHGFGYSSCDPSKTTEGLKTLFELHESRAKRKNIVSTFKGTRLFEFHKGLLHRTGENGWTWLRFIRKEEEIISAFYGFALGGHLFGYQMGIDPDWEQYGPGSVLIYEIIREAFSRGYKEYDLLRGNEGYKRDWTRNHRVLFSVDIYNKTVRGSLSKTVSLSKNLLKRNLKKIVSRPA